MTRIAVIGAGAVAGQHLRALREIADVEVTWIADPLLERAARLAGSTGARSTRLNVEAIAATNVDVVLVTTPAATHRDIVEMAANSGKHVLCEAPLAATVEDAEAMVAACAAADVRLLVGQSNRFAPDSERIKAALDSGDLGQIGIARVSRVGPPHADLSVTNDVMLHDLDLLRWWFGEVVRVYALGPRHATADYAQAVVRFDSGVIAYVEASLVHARFRTTIEIAGEHGVLTADSEESSPFRLDRSPADGAPPTVSRFGPWPERALHAQWRHFIDRLADGEPLLVGGGDGIRAMELAGAVKRSMATGESVRFESGRPIAAEASE